MSLLSRLRDAWSALRGDAVPVAEAAPAGPLVEASFSEIFGTPVPLSEYIFANGRLLTPIPWGPQQRKEKNVTVRTLYDHDRVRQNSRVLAETNPNAAGLIDRLCAYNVGKGSSTEVQAADEGDEPPKRLAGKVRDFLKAFKKQGGHLDRWPSLEKEMVRRLHVEGEFFLRFYPQKDGLTLVRFIQPDAIRPPVGEDSEGPWSFGIHTPDDDVLSPAAYCVHDFRTATDEIVEAQFVVHAKINCLSDQKRGIPSLYAVEEELRGSAKLRYAVREGAKNRASITYFRRHEQASQGAVRALQGAQAAFILDRPTDTGNQSQVYVEVLEPNSVVDIPSGLDPLPPPSDPNSASAGASVDQALEAVAARFGVPTWIVTGKSDTGNFAQALVAESPFTITLQDSQADLAQLSDACQTKALEIGAEQGLLPDDVLEQIDLLVSFPSPVSRNRLEETNRRKILHEANVLSETTWATEEGLDPAQQKQQMIEERADPVPPLPTKVPSLPVDPATGRTATPAQQGKAAPSGTPAARYAQLAAREQDDGRRDDDDSAGGK